MQYKIRLIIINDKAPLEINSEFSNIFLSKYFPNEFIEHSGNEYPIKPKIIKNIKIL